MATYSEEDLIKAFDAVKFRNLSLRKASKIYNIPRATLFKKKNAVFVEIERKMKKKERLRKKTERTIEESK